MQPSSKKGFTLIELLIVVVIIGILAAVAIPKFSKTKDRAARASGITDIRNLATSQEAYYADSNRYATIADTGNVPGRMNFTTSAGNTALALTGTTTGWSGVVDIQSGQCGIYHGAAARPAGMPVTIPSGVPVCW